MLTPQQLQRSLLGIYSNQKNAQAPAILILQNVPQGSIDPVFRLIREVKEFDSLVFQPFHIPCSPVLVTILGDGLHQRLAYPSPLPKPAMLCAHHPLASQHWLKLIDHQEKD